MGTGFRVTFHNVYHLKPFWFLSLVDVLLIQNNKKTNINSS